MHLHWLSLPVSLAAAFSGMVAHVAERERGAVLGRLPPAAAPTEAEGLPA